jgi:16S rRNA (uracil1498-N3)-methyltransferase
LSLHRFHIDPIHPGASQVTLSESESHHAIRVLRLTSGDHIECFDGNGHQLTAVIQDPHPKRTHCAITKSVVMPPEPGHDLVLAVGLIKTHDRLEFILEKATEIGVDAIWLFVADHSEKAKVREDKLLAYLIGAAKQSKRAYVPKLKLFSSLDAVLAEVAGRRIIIAHEKADRDQILTAVVGPGLLLVGPEGGFSDREVNLATSKGADMVTLGAFRLRTETAALSLLIRARFHLI